MVTASHETTQWAILTLLNSIMDHYFKLRYIGNSCVFLFTLNKSIDTFIFIIWDRPLFVRYERWCILWNSCTLGSGVLSPFFIVCLAKIQQSSETNFRLKSRPRVQKIPSRNSFRVARLFGANFLTDSTVLRQFLVHNETSKRANTGCSAYLCSLHFHSGGSERQ